MTVSDAGLLQGVFWCTWGQVLFCQPLIDTVTAFTYSRRLVEMFVMIELIERLSERTA